MRRQRWNVGLLAAFGACVAFWAAVGVEVARWLR